MLREFFFPRAEKQGNTVGKGQQGKHACGAWLKVGWILAGHWGDRVQPGSSAKRYRCRNAVHEKEQRIFFSLFLGFPGVIFGPLDLCREFRQYCRDIGWRYVSFHGEGYAWIRYYKVSGVNKDGPKRRAARPPGISERDEGEGVVNHTKTITPTSLV